MIKITISDLLKYDKHSYHINVYALSNNFNKTARVLYIYHPYYIVSVEKTTFKWVNNVYVCSSNHYVYASYESGLNHKYQNKIKTYKFIVYGRTHHVSFVTFNLNMVTYE